MYYIVFLKGESHGSDSGGCEARNAVTPGMMHAVSGALRQNGVGKGVLGAVRHGKKTVGVDATRDVYGKPGKVDIYSGRDVVELYRKMAFNDRPLRDCRRFRLGG